MDITPERVLLATFANMDGIFFCAAYALGAYGLRTPLSLMAIRGFFDFGKDVLWNEAHTRAKKSRIIAAFK